MNGRSKYGNCKVEHDGRVFHSKAEQRHYIDLKLLERGRQIHSLQCQPKFPIGINGVKICDVVADFSYFERGRFVVSDVKGFWTPLSRIKWKLAQAAYPDFEWRLVKA